VGPWLFPFDFGVVCPLFELKTVIEDRGIVMPEAHTMPQSMGAYRPVKKKKKKRPEIAFASSPGMMGDLRK